MSLTTKQALKKSSSSVGNLMGQNHFRKYNKQRVIRLLLQKLCQKTSEIEPLKFQKWRNKNNEFELAKKEGSSFQEIQKLLQNLNRKFVEFNADNLWMTMLLQQYSQKLVLLMEIFLKFIHKKEGDQLFEDGKDPEKQKIVGEHEKNKTLSKQQKKEKQEFINNVFSPSFEDIFNRRQCLGCINVVIDSKYGKTYYSTESQPPCIVFNESQAQFDIEKYKKVQLKKDICHLLNNCGGYVWIGVRRYKNLLEPVGINQITAIQQDKFRAQISKCPDTKVTFIPMMQYKYEVVASEYEENYGKQVMKCVPIEGKCIIRIKVSPQKNTCYELVKSQTHEKIIGFSQLNEQRIKNLYEKTQLQYLYTENENRQKTENGNGQIKNNNFSIYYYLHDKYREWSKINCMLQKCENKWKHQQARICSFTRETENKETVNKETENKETKTKKQVKEFRYQSMLTASVTIQKKFQQHLIQNKLGQMRFDLVSRKWGFNFSENTKDFVWLISHNQPDYEVQQIITLVANNGHKGDKIPILKRLDKIRLSQLQYREYEKEYEKKLKDYNFVQLRHSIQSRNKSRKIKSEPKDYDITLVFETCQAVAFAYLFFKSKQIQVQLINH